MQKLLKDSHYIYLIIILAVAALMRFYGLNWDQNQHLHPDERFITMVTQAVQWPANIGEYFATATSPLNPHNQNFPFYVYGTFPLFSVKFLSDLFGITDYNEITLLGRFTSGLLDVFVVLLIYLTSRKIFSKSTGLLSAYFYALLVLPIQLAHFYTMDVFLNLFLILTVYFLIRSFYEPKFRLFILAGISLGLAFASKISAYILGPAILLFFLYFIYKYKAKTLLWGITFFLSGLLVFRITQPYAFTGPSIFNINLNPKFIANLEEQQRLSQPNSYFPPAVQWNNTTPIIYPFKENLLWGMGLAAGLISCLAIFFVVIRIKDLGKERLFPVTILLSIILTIFFYQGIQFAKALRYFYPMYPGLMILSGYFIIEILKKFSAKRGSILCLALLLTWSLWPLSFISIYSRNHSRVEASVWIYQNIPAGSSLSAEHWDDALPLNLENQSNSIYQLIEFPLFGPDTNEKWSQMKEKLQQTDYIILSSNRLYGSISRNPNLYPQTYQYYQDLFNGVLGFHKVAEFTSRPNLPIPGMKLCLSLPFFDYGAVAKKTEECVQKGISVIDDYADEIDTVYDHPKVIIFSRR